MNFLPISLLLHLPEKHLGSGRVRSPLPTGILKREKLVVITNGGGVVKKPKPVLTESDAKLDIFEGGAFEIFVEVPAGSKEFGL